MGRPLNESVCQWILPLAYLVIHSKRLQHLNLLFKQKDICFLIIQALHKLTTSFMEYRTENYQPVAFLVEHTT